MTVTAADIQGLPSGEFATLSDSSIAPFIAEATRQLSVSKWGDLFDDGVRYLAAHLLAVMRRGSMGGAGPVIAETAGPISRSYASPVMASADGMASTAYGRRFIELRHIVAGGPVVL